MLLLFNDQPLQLVSTNSFIYADNLCLIIQQNTFEQVEFTLAGGLNELGTYYKENHLRSALCSPAPIFPGTYVPRTYVPRYLCSPVPSYVPRYRCSPIFVV